MKDREPLKKVKISYFITKCKECSACKTQQTPNSGCAIDWLCGESGNRLICGYIEWKKDEGGIPDWCPRREFTEEEKLEKLKVEQAKKLAEEREKVLKEQEEKKLYLRLKEKYEGG